MSILFSKIGEHHTCEDINDNSTLWCFYDAPPKCLSTVTKRPCNEMFL